MNKKKKYILVGIFTLVISVIGATYSYFMATASNTNSIVGNIATVHMDLNIEKKTSVDEVKGGLIPMTNAMVQSAVSNASTKGICVDNNNNAVCQIYKITINNAGSAVMFVDGYVTLTGGSGVSTDYPASPTTMRWAQVFCTENNNNLSTCTTAGSSTVRQTNNISWSALGNGVGHDTGEIKDYYNNVITTGTISGNNYNVINTNYIRVSSHTGSNYTQAGDVTSALVYNQLLNPNDNNVNNNTGDSSGTYTDSQTYYIVVWLSENGLNQTAGSGGTNVPNSKNNFFNGIVTFNSSDGNQVTGNFSGYVKVRDENVVRKTYYTVSIYDSNDLDNTSILIGKAIPSSITKYQTVAAARAAYNNKPFYLKQVLDNDIVQESYVEFIVTPEMASANPGMRSGTYSLRGDNLYDDGVCKPENINPDTGRCIVSSYYESNVQALKQAFGENSGYCDFTKTSPTSCTVSGLDIGAYLVGGVYVDDNTSRGCNVQYNGRSVCLVW